MEVEVAVEVQVEVVGTGVVFAEGGGARGGGGTSGPVPSPWWKGPSFGKTASRSACFAHSRASAAATAVRLLLEGWPILSPGTSSCHRRGRGVSSVPSRERRGGEGGRRGGAARLQPHARCRRRLLHRLPLRPRRPRETHLADALLRLRQGAALRRARERVGGAGGALE